MLGLQILIDGFAISALYALGAVGFTLIFGVSGVLNLSHGGIMVVAALIAWYAAGDLGVGAYGGALAGIARRAHGAAYASPISWWCGRSSARAPSRARRRRSSSSPARCCGASCSRSAWPISSPTTR